MSLRSNGAGAAPLAAGTRIATITAAAMIAQQVAGKAARDALFLSHFSIAALPATMAGAAVLSVIAALWMSRLITRRSPAAVVPIVFALSSVAFIVEWGVSLSSPRLATIVLYLHTTLFGAATLSAFWSLINEKFDPHSGKRAATWIAGGGTVGGVLGSLIAWRLSFFISVSTMFPLLAAANVFCALGSYRLRSALVRVPDVAGGATAPLSSLAVLRESPYLRNLSLIVTLGAITAGLLDYVLSAEAVKAYARGPALLSFFALFGLVVGVVSFALQILLGRIALEKLGLVITLALLPGFVVLGGAFGLAFPGLWSTVILRTGEAGQRNSLFRAAYEMLYTPLSEEKKRSAKALIDVGFDRLGTLIAGGVAMLTLLVLPARSTEVLLVVGVGCALVALAQSRPLHRGYVAVLEESLRHEALAEGISAEPPRISPGQQQKVEALRDEVVAHLAELVPTSAEPAAAEGGAELPLAAPVIEELAPSGHDSLVGAVIELCSGQAERARRVLAAETPLAAPLVSFAILLLADKDLHLDAIRALRKVVPSVTGQLVDALCDSVVDFDIRRRVPRVLSECPTQSAADGLVRGTDDDRFEVRYACGSALSRMTGPGTAVVISLERVVAMVKREVQIDKAVWESQPAPQFDDDENEPPALIDRLLRDRVDRTLEHVFRILALHLDRESLRIAFKALHEEDQRLRGTALEYLETVLPDEIRDAVWPILGEVRPMRAARSAKEILDDLVGARPGEVAEAKRVLAPAQPVDAKNRTSIGAEMA